MVVLDAAGRWMGDAPPVIALADWDLVSADIALAIPNRTNPAQIEADLSLVSTIVLEFPKFRDGRAYSQAKVLRDGLGYRGSLVASGDLLRDQIPLMLSVGFDYFWAKDEVHAARLAPAFLRPGPKRWAIG